MSDKLRDNKASRAAESMHSESRKLRSHCPKIETKPPKVPSEWNRRIFIDQYKVKPEKVRWLLTTRDDRMIRGDDLCR